MPCIEVITRIFSGALHLLLNHLLFCWQLSIRSRVSFVNFLRGSFSESLLLVKLCTVCIIGKIITFVSLIFLDNVDIIVMSKHL